MFDFESSDNIILGISNRYQGNMRVFVKKDHPDTISNREKFFAPFSKQVVAADLVHGNKVVMIEEGNQDDIILACDALVTDCSDYLLTITVADCLPVYFLDRVKRIVGIAHAGWRGVIGGVANEVATVFEKKYGSLRSDIEVFIGPHIGVCHFEVQNDVADKFSPYPETVVRREGKTFVDLAQVIKQQLVSSGLSSGNINISPECTFCLKDKYFSFRRDDPGLDNLEVMTAYIGLK